MHPAAARTQQGHRRRCQATILHAYPLGREREGALGYLREGVRLALVGICKFALDLRGESASACSLRPICPVETVHPH